MDKTIRQQQYESLEDIIIPAFEDERGAISNILSGIDIKHIAIITSKKGSVRGFHYHPEQEQYIFVLEGEMLAYSKALEADKPTHSLLLKKNYLAYCPPNVAHVYKALTDVVFLNITTGTRGDYGNDTIAYKWEIPTL